MLPARHYFEYDWIQGTSARRSSTTANKVVEPIGEAKVDVDIFREIDARGDDP